MNKFHWIVCLIFLFCGCSGDTILNKLENLPEHGWSQSNTINMEFEITDTTRYSNIYLNLRITGDYPFSNMYVLSTITLPDSSVQSIRSHHILAEDNGKWTGSGMGDIISYEQPIALHQPFKQKGRYRLQLKQYMRMDTLPAVRDVGVRIEKGEIIF